MNTIVLERNIPQVVRAGLETCEVRVKDLRLLEGLGQEVTTYAQHHSSDIYPAAQATLITLSGHLLHTKTVSILSILHAYRPGTP